MKRTVMVVGIAAVLSAAARAQQPTPGPVPSDTTAVVQGLIGQEPGSSVWLLALPVPFRFRDRVIAELELGGRDTRRWIGFDSHYVEARGTVGVEPVAGHPFRGRLHVTAVREVDPAGTARRMVSNSWTHRVAATLWVLPQTFAWVDEQGRPTGVGPTIVYTLNNHGESDVALQLGSRDFACFSVEPKAGGAPPWTFVRRLDQPNERPSIILPKFVRETTRLPRDAAPTPGRYLVRASLCGFKEYELETELQVQR
ncbi:MAG TPA: hypothetical protein VGQ06_15225 [Gemmatimonadales bacterium]|jgi:hypothetical protein|nr:hypothetical protein [Gemmatimonadales bacterium]